jgi:dTDP-4-dehydrorhamnose 3,5-epimerase-like enzyme
MDRRYKVFTLKNIQAPNFTMTALELKDYIDFPVKRIYFITSPINDLKTGNHAHRQDEDELFVQLQGNSTICVDDGHGMEDVKLDGPRQAISVPHLVWHGFKDLSPDAIIVALTSTNYDPSRADYIENYEEFKRIVGESPTGKL